MDSYNTYKFEGASGVNAFLAVVMGAADGGCNLPGGANAKGFVGFTTDNLESPGTGIAITVKRGRCRATAAGVITRGDWVNIAGASGKVQSCQAAVDAAPGTPADTYVIGKAETTTAADGDPIVIQTMEFVAKVATS